jgi:mono/diheme cytochrome c family protein
MRAVAKAVLALAASALTLAAAHAEPGSLIQKAPAKSLRLKNPYQGSEGAAQAGAKLYRRSCAPCHGNRAEGAENAPPLNRKDIREASPGALFWVLRNGSARHGMPSFAHLPEPQRWQIVSYLQSLQGGHKAKTDQRTDAEPKSRAEEP